MSKQNGQQIANGTDGRRPASRDLLKVDGPIDVKSETRAMRRYSRDLVSRGVKASVDYGSFKSAPFSVTANAQQTALAPSLGFFCADILGGILDSLPGGLYTEQSIQRNLQISFDNLNTNSLFYALRYLLQEILIVFQNMKCHYSASRAFYRKLYEITLAFGRSRRGLYARCETKVSQETVRLIQELEELLDEKLRYFKVFTYPDEYIQYLLIGGNIKKEFNDFESSLQSLMTRIYTEVYHDTPNMDDLDEFIGLIPMDGFDVVVDLKFVIENALLLPRLDPPSVASETSPSPPSTQITSSPSSRHLIKTPSFMESPIKSNPKKIYDSWKFFIVKNYKTIFELCDPTKFPYDQFVDETGTTVDPDSAEASDLHKDFVNHLAGEFQKILRKYEKMKAVVEVTSYPSYANVIPNIPLRLFWAKYIGDVYEVNLNLFQKALVDYLQSEAQYANSKAKSFAFPVVKALQFYSTLTFVNVGNDVKPKGTEQALNDNQSLSIFTITAFDIVAFTSSVPASESDTLIKFFKAFVKLHLSGTIAMYPNQDHNGVYNPFDIVSDKELKKLIYLFKTRRGLVNIPENQPPRNTGRSTSILYLLGKIKGEIQTVYLDFNHASSEGSLYSSLLSQLHLKYSSTAVSPGNPPSQTPASYMAASAYVTKELFFKYFGLILDKLGKDALIVFDNIEAQSQSTPLPPPSNGNGILIKRPSFSRAFSMNTTGLNTSGISEFISELIEFCHNGEGYLKRFVFLFVGGPSEKLAKYEADGSARSIDLPTYNDNQLKQMSLEIFPQDYRAIYELSNSFVGHIVTISDILNLRIIRQLSHIYDARKQAVAVLNGLTKTTKEYDEQILRGLIFNSICKSFAHLDDELLCASCILPNIGAFHYGLGWYLCKNAFDSDIMKWHTAFMNLNRLGYFDYLGRNIYTVSKYHNAETSFEYRNYFSSTARSNETTNPEVIYFPFVTSVVLQEQWDMYYEYWSKEMYRMAVTAIVSPQVLDYFPIVYPHFRQVFANFGLFPKITLTDPRNPNKKIIVNIDAYDKLKAKAVAASKDKDVVNASASSTPSASATSPAKIDQSKLKASKLPVIAFALAGGVGKVLSRYYPANAAQLIAASIVEALDVTKITKAITETSPGATGLNSSESAVVAGDEEDEDDDDDAVTTISAFPANTNAVAIHSLEEKYYGAICDLLDQIIRDENDSSSLSNRGLKQSASIIKMFFPLKKLSKTQVQPNLTLIRCLIVSGNIKLNLNQPRKSKAYFQRAYEMVCELESQPGNAVLAADPLEPLGKYKQALMKVLTPQTSTGSYEATSASPTLPSPTLKRQGSTNSNRSMATVSSTATTKRPSSTDLGKANGRKSVSKDEKCVVM